MVDNLKYILGITGSDYDMILIIVSCFLIFYVVYTVFSLLKVLFVGK